MNADTTDAFDTKAVVSMVEQQLREKLLKYKVALQPNKQPIIWRTLCETIENDLVPIDVHTPMWLWSRGKFSIEI